MGGSSGWVERVGGSRGWVGSERGWVGSLRGRVGSECQDCEVKWVWVCDTLELGAVAETRGRHTRNTPVCSFVTCVNRHGDHDNDSNDDNNVRISS